MKETQSTLVSMLVGISFLLCIGCGESEPVDEGEPLEATSTEAPNTPEAKKQKKSHSLIKNSFAAAEESLDKGDYDKAAQVLLKMQMSGALKNNEDSWRYSSLMTEVQTVLASAAADGDEKAQRTIEMLRQSRGPQ